MYKIHVRFREADLTPKLLKRIKEGHTLLEACLNAGINLRHDCGGVCICGTCSVHVLEGDQYLSSKNKREEDVLAKIYNSKSDCRLCCQCLLGKGKGRIIIAVPDRR